MIMTQIFSDDPNAIEKLNSKLEKLNEEKAYWKGLKPEPRTYQQETDNMKRCYMLPNLNANIRSVKKRIEKLKALVSNNETLVRNTTFKEGRKCFYYTKEPIEA